MFVSNEGNLSAGDGGFDVNNCWDLFTYRARLETPHSLRELLILLSRCERQYSTLLAVSAALRVNVKRPARSDPDLPLLP